MFKGITEAVSLPSSLLVGIRCPMGSANLDRSGCQIVAGDLDYIANQTAIREGFDLGWEKWEHRVRTTFEVSRRESISLVSLYARSRSLDEADLLERLARIANDYPEISVLLHFFKGEGIARALEIYQGRPLINYVSGESWALKRILPVLRCHPVPVVIQPIGDAGIPPTATARLEVVSRVADALGKIGLDQQDMYVDALTPTLGMAHIPLRTSIETVAAAREAGFRTILWPANAGLGHPDGETIAATYAAIAVRVGLDLAVVATGSQFLCATIANANLILERGNQ
jgi:cobalamin-dependent methionine synthase I